MPREKRGRSHAQGERRCLGANFVRARRPFRQRVLDACMNAFANNTLALGLPNLCSGRAGAQHDHIAACLAVMIVMVTKMTADRTIMMASDQPMNICIRVNPLTISGSLSNVFNVMAASVQTIIVVSEIRNVAKNHVFMRSRGFRLVLNTIQK